MIQSVWSVSSKSSSCSSLSSLCPGTFVAALQMSEIPHNLCARNGCSSFKDINCSRCHIQTPHPEVSDEGNACWLHLHNTFRKVVVDPSQTPSDQILFFVSITVDVYADPFGGPSRPTKFSGSEVDAEDCAGRVAHLGASLALADILLPRLPTSQSGFLCQDFLQRWC